MLEAWKGRKLSFSGEPLKALWRRSHFYLEEGFRYGEIEAGARDPGGRDQCEQRARGATGWAEGTSLPPLLPRVSAWLSRDCSIDKKLLPRRLVTGKDVSNEA